ncbi:MAG TPA: 4-(cytidine 5'-diphospho)-2-C-methyl-D-erythritol kinase [Terracidiphilus sp.]
MATTVRSHAKINLGLYIGVPRADGFHELTTVYQTLEVHDLVTVTARPASTTSIRLTTNDPRVPTDPRNTAWKMVSLALAEFRSPAEVLIHIEKRLPIQGGLGAGSGNAAAALVGLETELQVSRNAGAATAETVLSWLDFKQFAENTGIGDGAARQIEWAAKVGSDVPLFLVGGAVLGRGRGERVFPLADFEPTWCVLAVPPLGVSTPQAFRDWDALCATEGLTPDASADRLERLSRAYASAFAGAIPQDGQRPGSSGVLSSGKDLAGPVESALVRTGITRWVENDFERVVFPQQPILCDIKRLLAGTGNPEAAGHSTSLLASLSGSGSALFGLYKTRGDAEAAKARVEAGVKDMRIQCTVTRTLSRSAYWQGMLQK